MHLLNDDMSLISGRKPIAHTWFNKCTMCVQITDGSMLPAYKEGTYLFCEKVSLAQLEPGKSYVFGVRTPPHYTDVFRVFDSLVDGAIQISAKNLTVGACEPIPLADLIDIYVPKWKCIMETQE